LSDEELKKLMEEKAPKKTEGTEEKEPTEKTEQDGTNN
jgi:hypothetical protein